MEPNPHHRQEHWNTVYQTKETDQVSWYEPVPAESLRFIDEAKLPQSARIIDVGGGDSRLVDCLLERGFEQVTVLDISAAALDRARRRLGAQANRVTWVVADATRFRPDTPFDFWHDRAAFHFLTSQSEITDYLTLIRDNLAATGRLVVGTFAEDGPGRCSGLPVQQYSETQLTATLGQFFNKRYCQRVEHPTPFGTLQPFTFCSFGQRSA
ncbi:class I SAM-dependent methyltransferase [Spirosoma horti]|uniref:SAM-dependent methyltransferase n=1 Tax=Spirosoma pollinicola TaxID=2057025 RepID=A0A2K8Z6B4_9BACT|nr:class I SAM-dependent methyltransferase [Spirosoma pollinicola]AUD05413.1 SAM-dependent methyltransferase [Spirosoma pollinicola]RYF78232.1 MAG: class I SAM-dependent methyltransferase [Cytophagaceae bacterium]